jgi:6-phosphogluconolactonase (cycloisomerase 2 family)
MVKNTISVGLVALFLSVPVSAVKLWATSYNDHAVTTLDFSGSSLSVLGKNLDCGSEPTWLTLDKANSLLYCLNEGWGGAASLTSYQVNSDDSISTLDSIPVLKSPVAGSVYGPNNGGLAVAH